MRSVQRRPLVGPLVGQVVLLGVVDLAVGLDGRGWWVGVGCALGLTVLVARALVVAAMPGLGPADRVTLARAGLATAVAALTAGSSTAGLRPSARVLLVALCGVALLLDGVDGAVARRTSTATPFGARFDLEVDAFLILVLSVLVARTSGPWVLLIGAARYLFVMAGWGLPWLRRTLPPRFWRKVVAATQGVVLTAAAAQVGPGWLTTLALVAAFGLLAESFGRDTWWLWVRRDQEPGTAAPWVRTTDAALLHSGDGDA